MHALYLIIIAIIAVGVATAIARTIGGVVVVRVERVADAARRDDGRVGGQAAGADAQEEGGLSRIGEQQGVDVGGLALDEGVAPGARPVQEDRDERPVELEHGYQQEIAGGHGGLDGDWEEEVGETETERLGDEGEEGSDMVLGFVDRGG